MNEEWMNAESGSEELKANEERFFTDDGDADVPPDLNKNEVPLIDWGFESVRKDGQKDTEDEFVELEPEEEAPEAVCEGSDEPAPAEECPEAVVEPAPEEISEAAEEPAPEEISEAAEEPVTEAVPEEPAEPDASAELLLQAEAERTALLKAELAEMKESIEKHFQAIRTMLKYTKEKDNNVNKLSMSMQMYRDGVELSLLKSVALQVIGYREDCRKTLREFEKREPDLASCEKYLKYAKMDYEDLLENLGVENRDGLWFYNGKNLADDELKAVPFEELAEAEYEELPQAEVQTKEELAAYLAAVEENLAGILKRNVYLDKVLEKYIENASLYEKGIQQIVLYPVIWNIIRKYEETEERIDSTVAELTEENCRECYLDTLRMLIDAAEDILLSCGVTIESEVSDTLDNKKNRVLKVIPTDMSWQNGLIAFRYTDCYLMGDRVIYQQKADVYKKQN